MSEIIEGVISGNISCDDVILWLTTSTLSPSIQENVLGKLDSADTKQHFVVYILNNIRKIAANVNGASGIKSVQSDDNSEIRKNEYEKCEVHSCGKRVVQSDDNSPSLQFPKPKSQPHVNKLSSSCAISHHNSHFKKHSKPSKKGDTLQNSESKLSRNFDLNISDTSVFPTVGDALIRSKRITPTRVISHTGDVKNATPRTLYPLDTLHQREIKPLQTNAVFCGINPDFYTPIIEAGKDFNFDQERALLRKERTNSEKLLFTNECGGKSIRLDCSNLTNNISWTPSPQEVSDQNHLCSFVRIYVCIFQENLVPNIVSELYCVLRLLNCNKTDYVHNAEEGINVLFNNPHNCVYFAAQVLLKLQRLICMLDKGTIGLLADNTRIKTFCPDLHHILHDIYILLSPLEVLTNTNGNFIENVAFVIDTDKRENFVSDADFSTFRKQRNLFYELLREWEHEQQSPAWSMKIAQGSHVKQIVSWSQHPFTFTHFARLFISQLIAITSGDSASPQDIPSAEVVSILQKNDPNKFHRLQKRLVGSTESRGPCPIPYFTLSQEFFKEFIDLAASPIFNQHLIDGLVTRIYEINDKDSQGLGNDENSIGPTNSRMCFVTCVATLRILAKFLGYITFLPYKHDVALPRELMVIQVSLRQKSLPPLDLTAILKFGNLITITWALEFLAMADSCSIHLPYYKKILMTLWNYCRSPALKTSIDRDMNYHKLFQLSVLGWFFEIVNLPAEYFNSEDKEDGHDSFHISNHDVEVVDQVVLYSCCPYWAELRFLLSDFVEGSFSQSGYVRKITPVSVNNGMYRSKLSAEQRLQLKLEANFLSTNSVSSRKMMEFVSDKVASNAIEDVCIKTVNDARTRSKYSIKAEIKDRLAADPDFRKNYEKKWLREAVESSSNKIWNEVVTCLETADLYVKKKVTSSLPLLLPEETSAAVMDMYANITCRLAMEKVSQWAESSITRQLFNDWCSAEFGRHLNRTQNRMEEITIDHVNTAKIKTQEYTCYESLPLVTDVIVNLKEVVRSLLSYETQYFPDRNVVEQTILQVKLLVRNKKDVAHVHQLLMQLSADFSIGLVQCCPVLMDDMMQEKFMDLWKTDCGDYPYLRCIVSRKTILLLQLSHSQQLSWKCWAALVKNMLKFQLLHSSRFCEQCLHIMHSDQQWPTETFSNFATAVYGIIRDGNIENEVCNKVDCDIITKRLNELSFKS